jgi:hypothetical protein
MHIAIRALLVMLFSLSAQGGPRDGWWWNPAEPGRGFFLERQGEAMFMSAFFYAADGRATWLVSNAAMPDPDSYNGRLLAFANGQTLHGVYRPPDPAVDAGPVSVVFAGDRQATLTWEGGTIPIIRHDFRQGASTADPPRTGWWWNPAEPGRGFSIELQGEHMFIGAYMYDALGNPVWYVADVLLPTRYIVGGTLLQFAGGQTLTGSYRTPGAPAAAGQLAIEFISPGQAKMVLFPAGPEAREARFDIEPQYGKPRPASASARLWVGGFEETRVSTYGAIRNVTTVRVPLMTWLQPMASDTGGHPALYTIAGGAATVTLRQTDEVCTREGEGHAELFQGDESDDFPSAGELRLDADGSYTGQIRQAVLVRVTETCNYSSGPVVTNGAYYHTFEYPLRGRLIDGQMTGVSPPSRLAGVTVAGNWNFTPQF